MLSASGIIQGKSQFLAFDFRNPSSQGEEKECGLWTKDLKESLMTKSQGTTPINPPPLLHTQIQISGDCKARCM